MTDSSKLMSHLMDTAAADAGVNAGRAGLACGTPGAAAGADLRAAVGAAAGEPRSHSPNIDAVMQIPVAVKIVLGSATMPVAGLVRLGRGSVIALDRKVGEPVDVMVNGRLVARGEVVVLEEDNSRFGISLTEVVGSGPGGGTEQPRREA